MANSTLTPNTREEQDDYNDPTKVRRNLSAAENGAYTDSGIDQAEAFANDPKNSTAAVKKAEENPMGYEDTSENSGRGRITGKKPIGVLKVLNRGGPVGLIIGIVLGFGALMFGSFSLLPVHLYESFMDKYDSQTTSYTIRTNRVLAAKLSNANTSGVCTEFVTIRCRFTRPSNYMLKQLDKNGIKAFKGDAEVDKRLAFPNARPDRFEFTDSSGKKLSIDAKNLTKTLATNADFRAAFHAANKTRLQTFSDSVFRRVAAKFGFSKEDKYKNAKTEKAVRDITNDDVKGSDVGAENAKTSGSADEAKQVVSDLLNGQVEKETGKLARAGVGNAFGLAAGAVCLVADTPSIITRTARAYQMAQLVKFAALFLTTASALKAGDATPEEVNATANALTTTVDGKSALDSFGVRYSLYGDTAQNDDKNFSKFVPGGAAAAALGTVALYLSSDVKRNVCNAAASPVTGAVIDILIGPETLGLGTLANIAVGTAAALVIANAVPPIISFLLSNIDPQIYLNMMNLFLGDVTQNLSGMDYGDALSSGAAHTLGQVANAGGNIPLSVDDAVAYEQQTKAVNLAYAEEDRATLSPFDASNQNTMMGSIVSQFIPYAAKMSSLGGMISSFANVTGKSFGSALMGKTFAADTGADQYTGCKDQSIASVDGQTSAAGPFCNLIYGIPPQFLEMDSQAIVDDLVAAGQIDPNTGEAIQGVDHFVTQATDTLGVPRGGTITSYADWLETCTDGGTDQAVNCQVKDKQTAEFALYTIDHRIQKNMDDEDTDPEADAETGDGNGNTENADAPSGTKRELAKAILDSGKVSFLDGVNSSSAARKKVFSDIANGTTDGNSFPCGMNIKVLQLVKYLADHHRSLMIGDANSACTGAGQGRRQSSRHIGGNGSAVDINSIDGNYINGWNPASIALIREITPLLSTGSSIANQSQVGQSVDRANHGVSVSLPGVHQFDDFPSHLHVDFPTNDDKSLKIRYGAY